MFDNFLHKVILENNPKVGIIIHNTRNLVICQLINKLGGLFGPGDRVLLGNLKTRLNDESGVRGTYRHVTDVNRGVSGCRCCD